MAKKVITLSADFETTKVDIDPHHPQTSITDKPEVYSWCITYIGDELTKNLWTLENLNVRYDKIEWAGDTYSRYYGIDILSFIELTRNFKKDVEIFFNNMKGFDGHFILAEFIRMRLSEWEHIKLIEQSNIDTIRARFLAIHKMYEKNKKYQALAKEDRKEFILSKWRTWTSNDYNVMINDKSQIYKIEYGSHQTIRNKDILKARKVQIKDNFLLWPMSVKAMGETLAKELNGDLKTYGKEELSSNYNRREKYHSLEELEQDGNELWYLTKDTLIVHKFQALMETHFPRNKWKLTAAATAMNLVKEHFRLGQIQKCIDNGEFKPVYQKNGGILYKNTITQKPTTIKGIQVSLWNKMLPLNWLTPDIHGRMYPYYKGGLSIVNEKHRGQVRKNVSVHDENSAYPGIMASKLPCPYGAPIFGDTTDPEYSFKFYRVTVIKPMKNEKGLPFLFSEQQTRRYYNTTLQPGTYTMVTPEYERFLKYYNGEEGEHFIKTVEYSFKVTTFEFFFGEYVRKYYELKSDASKKGLAGLKVLCKVMLNSPYGKFGTKSLREGYDFIDGEWINKSEILESKFYLPIACAITAYARMKLVDAVGDKYDRIVYLDTDSLFIINYVPEDFPGIVQDPYELGLWDKEADNLMIVVRRSKQYFGVDVKTGHIKMAFAGLNANRNLFSDKELEHIEDNTTILESLTFSDYIYGRTISNQVGNLKVHGTGVIIYELEKAIKPIWEYNPYPEQIYFNKEHFINQNLNKYDEILKSCRD